MPREANASGWDAAQLATEQQTAYRRSTAGTSGGTPRLLCSFSQLDSAGRGLAVVAVGAASRGGNSSSSRRFLQ